MTFPRKHKYNAKPLEYKGHKYPSTAEAECAMQLDQLKADGEIAWWLGQVTFPLGEDEKYRVDFMVVTFYMWPNHTCVIHAEDIKGAETPAFKKIRKLWAKYGPCDLHVIKGGKAEVVEGGGA